MIPNNVQEQIEREYPTDEQSAINTIKGIYGEGTHMIHESKVINRAIVDAIDKRNAALRGAEIALENAIKEIDKEMNKKLRGSSQDYLDGYLHGLAKASLLLTPPKP